MKKQFIYIKSKLLNKDQVPFVEFVKYKRKNYHNSKETLKLLELVLIYATCMYVCNSGEL